MLWLLSEFVDSSKGWTLVLSDNSEVDLSVNSPLDLLEGSSIDLLVDSWTCVLDEIILLDSLISILTSIEFVDIYCFVSIVFIFVDNWFIIFWTVEGTVILLDVVGIVVEMLDLISLGAVLGILVEAVVGTGLGVVAGTELGTVVGKILGTVVETTFGMY